MVARLAPPAVSGWDYSPTGMNPAVASGWKNIDSNFRYLIQCKPEIFNRPALLLAKLIMAFGQQNGCK